MARACDGAGVGIVAILKPDPVLAQAAKAIVAEKLLPTNRVVTPELVEDEDDSKLDDWLILFGL